MHYFKLKYGDGTYEIVKAPSMESVIKKRRLYKWKHRHTRIVELSGEQLAIAIANDQEENHE